MPKDKSFKQDMIAWNQRKRYVDQVNLVQSNVGKPPIKYKLKPKPKMTQVEKNKICDERLANATGIYKISLNHVALSAEIRKGATVEFVADKYKLDLALLREWVDKYQEYFYVV